MHELGKFIANWNTGCQFFLALLLLYSVAYSLGLLLLYPFRKQLTNLSVYVKLFYVNLVGTVSLITAFSIVISRFKTVHVLLLAIALLVVFKYRKNINSKFTFGEFASYFKQNFKYFLLSIVLLFMFQLIMLLKFDYFNSSVITIYDDYSSYAAIAKKMLLNNAESAYYLLPNSAINAPYTLYHYADVWLTAFVLLLPTNINGHGVYAFVIIPFLLTIFFVGCLSLIDISTPQNKLSKTIFIASLFSFLVIGFIYLQVPKSLLSFSMLIACFHLHNNKNLTLLLSAAIFVAIINPLYLVLVPLYFLYVFWYYYLNNLSKKKQGVWCLILAFAACCVAIIIFKQTNTLNADGLKQIVIEIKKFRYDFLYSNILKLGIILLLLKAFKYNVAFNTAEKVMIIFCVIFLVEGKIIGITNVLNSNESFQFKILTDLFFYFFIISLLFRKLPMAHFQNKYYAIGLNIVLLFFIFGNTVCALNFGKSSRNYGNKYNKQFVAKVEKILSSKGNTFGFFLQYKDTNLSNLNAYRKQRPDFNRFTQFASIFENKTAFATPIVIPNSIYTLDSSTKKFWLLNDFFNYQLVTKKHAINYSDSLCFESYVAAQNIQLIFVAGPIEQVPSYITNSFALFASDSLGILKCLKQK